MGIHHLESGPVPPDREADPHRRHPSVSETTTGAYETDLDPRDDAGWHELEQLGRRMLGDMLRSLRDVREEPAWRPVPAYVQADLRAPVPWTAEGAERAYADFQRLVLPYRLGNVHPRFWGRMQGTGTVVGMLASSMSLMPYSSVAVAALV